MNRPTTHQTDLQNPVVPQTRSFGSWALLLLLVATGSLVVAPSLGLASDATSSLPASYSFQNRPVGGQGVHSLYQGLFEGPKPKFQDQDPETFLDVLSCFGAQGTGKPSRPL